MHRILRLPLLFILTVVYVIYHIMSGNRSVFVYLEKKKIIEKKSSNLEDLKKSVALLENKINRLQDTNPDLDLLEEEARKVLGQSDPKEIVLIR